MSSPKIRIKKIFMEALNEIENGRKPSISGIMRKYGYADTSAKVLKVTTTKTWKNLLDKMIDDEKILERLNEIAMDKEDKRACLQAIDMILKLKDKYPQHKTKIMGLFGAIQKQIQGQEEDDFNNNSL
jgi:hypothetical protein